MHCQLIVCIGQFGCLSRGKLALAVAQRIRYRWALLVTCVLGLTPGAYTDAPDNKPSLTRVRAPHDSDAESESPAQAIREPQRAQISPVQMVPARTLITYPQWDAYEADHWAVQRTLQGKMLRNIAAFQPQRVPWHTARR